MRWQLLPLLVAFVLAGSEEQQDYEHFRNLLKSWKHGEATTYVENPRAMRFSVVDEFSHVRHKRSVMTSRADVEANKYILADKSCQTPGYTGDDCQNPICPLMNMDVPDMPDIDGMGVTFDIVNLANCSSKYVILIDETMKNIRLELETDASINPFFALQNEQGQVMVPESFNVDFNEQQYNAFWPSLPAGRYVVVPFADVATHYCRLICRAHSVLNIVGGFVNMEGQQPERNDFPTPKLVYKDQLGVGVFHANGLHSPGQIKSVGYTGPSNLAYRQHQLFPRYNCSYEFFHESFLCRVTGSYMYHIEGVTHMGYNFRRVYPFVCANAPATTTTVGPITTSGPLVCQNGGLLINGPGGTYCFCPQTYTGKDCSQIICLNDGVVKNNKCLCADGFQGDHCEHVVCDNEAGLRFEANHPTLTLVIRARKQMNGVVSQVLNATTQIFNDLQFEPGYLDAFVIAVFNQDRLLYYGRATSIGDITDALSRYTEDDDDSGGCTDAVFGAMAAALENSITNKSPVYLVTDASPDDPDQAETVFWVNSLYRAPIHVLYIKPLVTDNCVVTPDSSGYRKLNSIAQRTGGEIFYVDDRNNVQNLLYSHMSYTIYRSQLMFSNDYQTCGDQKNYQTVSVDSKVDTLTITGVGNNLKLKVLMPEGTPYTLTDTIYQDNNSAIWSINGLHTGNWQFEVTSADPTSACGFKIMQKSYNYIAQTPRYDIFWAFSEAVNVDGFFTEPLYEADTSVVFHVVDFPVLPEEMVHSNLIVYANRDGKQVTVYSSNGIYRDMCSFHFYFPSFRCRVAGEALYFNFFVRDERGTAIQRAGTFTCLQIQPTIQPPGSCQNGGVLNPANTTCFCPPGYNGTYCEQVSCFNGGTPAGPRCNCLTGWTGTFCEYPACPISNAPPELFMKFVDMVFVVELTQNGFAQISYLNSYFSTVIRDVQAQNPHWIERFVLVAYNTTWSDVINVSHAYNTSGIVKALDDLINNAAANLNSLDPGCGTQLYGAMETAVKMHDMNPGSFVQLFSVSPGSTRDLDQNWLDFYEYLRQMKIRVTAYLGVSPRNTGNPYGLYCNATLEDFGPLNAITYSGLGSMYPTQQATIAQVLKTIPLQYFNGLSYIQGYDDCTSPQTLFFPIDSYTQTIQLDIYGAKPTITVNDGDGNTWNPLLLVNDDFSKWSIQEVRKPCDDGWIPNGQYCMFYETEHASWPNAKKFCHSAGGQLADDMTQDSHAFLSNEGPYSFWIGGFNDGVWKWDSPDGTTPQPIQTTPTYWDNDTPPTDPQQQCMSFQGRINGQSGDWVGATCSNQKFFICQKHRYDLNYRPQDLEEGDLLAGKWSLTIQTKNDADPTNNACQVNVRVQSALQMSSGFTQFLSNDFPDNDPIVDSPNNMVMGYLHTEDNENRTPLLTMAYILDAYTGNFVNAARYQFRFGCAYPWVSQTFTCPADSSDYTELALLHTGEDEFGQLFSRVTFGHCSQKVLTCGNGGYRWNGTCVCDEYWQGNFCTVPLCVNGGNLNSDSNACICPDGYTGTSCQYEQCTRREPSTFIKTSKTLIFMIETTQQNKDAANNIATNMASIIQKTKDVDSNWFINFILVTFDSTGVYMDHFDDVASLTAALNARIAAISDPGTCNMPLYGALSTFLNNTDLMLFVQWPRSEMFVVSSAGTNDAASYLASDLHFLADMQIIVHYVYVTSTTCGQQPQQGLRNIARLVYTTDGNLGFVSSDSVADYINAYLPSRFGMNTLTNPTASRNYTCTSDNMWYAQVDSGTDYLYISTASDIGDIGIVDSFKQTISAKRIFNGTQTTIYQADVRGVSGIYSFNLKSPGDCFVSIYATSGVTVYSLYAFTTGSNPTGSRQDGLYHSPSAGFDNVLTVHMDAGEQSRGGRLTYAVIFDVDSKQQLVHSELYRRANCSFEFVSDPFTCNSDLLRVYIHGIDQNHVNFRREYSAYCVGNTKTTTSPNTATPGLTTAAPPVTQPKVTTNIPITAPATGSPTTSYGYANQNFDVVFLIDVSASASATLTKINKFVQTLMLSYSVGQDHARVGIVPVFGMNFGIFSVNPLNALTSQTSLIGALNDLTEYADFDDVGQYLQSAFQSASDPNYLSAGYRSAIKNHLIIYITSASSFSDSPNPASILTANTFGIISIGFGPSVMDATTLAAVSGGSSCAFSTNDEHALNTNILNSVQALIWSADSNGKYCGN